jgi:hypothetical protein
VKESKYIPLLASNPVAERMNDEFPPSEWIVEQSWRQDGHYRISHRSQPEKVFMRLTGPEGARKYKEEIEGRGGKTEKVETKGGKEKRKRSSKSLENDSESDSQSGSGSTLRRKKSKSSSPVPDPRDSLGQVTVHESPPDEEGVIFGKRADK